MADYFLLILMERLANKELHEWQDKIEVVGSIYPEKPVLMDFNIEPLG